ncbi:hypothetical protein VTK56DRAFT_9480 [Thermocarpiscus australiensis]
MISSNILYLEDSKYCSDYYIDIFHPLSSAMPSCCIDRLRRTGIQTLCTALRILKQSGWGQLRFNWGKCHAAQNDTLAILQLLYDIGGDVGSVGDMVVVVRMSLSFRVSMKVRAG